MTRAFQITVRRALPALLGVAALTPAGAHAAVGAGMTMSFPVAVSPGQTAVPAWIAVQNLNTPPDTASSNGVCSAGDPSPPCAAGEPGILVVPSCKQIVNDICTAAGADPGVLQVSPTATGRAGSACAGRTFTTAVVDKAFGTVRFNPPAREHVSLPPTNPTCTIDFIVNVGKAPTGDVNPDAPGTQIGQTARHTQWLGAPGSTTTHADARAALGGTTVVSSPGDVPPCNDCDDDGFLAKVDCDDTRKTIHPGAFDRPGDDLDADCDGRDAPYPSIGSRLSFSYTVDERGTHFTLLVLRQARTNTTVNVRCAGKGCRFKSRTRRITQNRRSVDLLSLVRRLRLRSRARLQISVTRPETIGLQRTFTARTGKPAIETERCLVPGQRKPAVCET